MNSRRYLLFSALASILVAAAALLFFLPSREAGRSIPSTSTSTQGGAAPWYRVHFTAPKYPDLAAEHRGGLDERLAAFIATAASSVDTAIYQLDAPAVTRALVEAKGRGALVRVVTDIDVLEDPEENAAFLELESAGVPVVGGNSDAIMHDKFVVIDGRALWTGTWNFTIDDTYRYDNAGVEIRSPELAREYTIAFERLFVERRFGVKREPGAASRTVTMGTSTLESFFAPGEEAAARIVSMLEAARERIDFLAFSFTDDDIGRAVMDRAKAGVAVRGVFENTGSGTRYSEYGAMKKAGLDVRQDGNPYFMHLKAIIVDGRSVAFGSYNFTANARDDNDENLLVVEDEGFAAAFEAEFDAVYARAAGMR